MHRFFGTSLFFVAMLWFVYLQEEWPEDDAAREQIKVDFSTDPSIGDRRQELVFIGQVGVCVCVGGCMVFINLGFCGFVYSSRLVLVSCARRQASSLA